MPECPHGQEGKIRLTAGQADGSQEINLSVRKIERSVGEGRDERGGTVEEGIIFLASRMTPETFLPWPFGALEPPLQLL